MKIFIFSLTNKNRRFYWFSGDGNVVNDKRFIGPTLDVSTDSGDIRFGIIVCSSRMIEE